MRKLEILTGMLDLTRTVSEAVDFVMQNSDTNLSVELVLRDIKDALESMSSNILLIFESKKAEEINQHLRKLQKSCDTLIGNSKTVDSFSKTYTGLKNILEKSLYLETINTAKTCSNDDDDLAIASMELLLSYNLMPQFKALASFVLSRRLCVKQPLRAYNLAIEAFESDNTLCAYITQKDAPVHNYVYHNVKEIYFENCPICHDEAGEPYYCAIPMYMSNYTSFFSPVKLWMKCSSCGQLYAYNFPEKLVIPEPDVEELGDEIYMNPRLEFLPTLGRILKQVLSFSSGNKLLEVGAGTGELVAAALELGCDVEAVEISKRQSIRLKDLLGINVHCMDFLKYHTSGKYSIISMGDVIEHVINPVAALSKAYELLESEGILWISTPNFESGFSRIMKFNDPMWNEPWHMTYFSYTGFKKLLNENGFQILDYEVSQRYNGSMEITARKI